jgi:hypothetical protein
VGRYTSAHGFCFEAEPPPSDLLDSQKRSASKKPWAKKLMAFCFGWQNEEGRRRENG